MDWAGLQHRFLHVEPAKREKGGICRQDALLFLFPILRFGHFPECLCQGSRPDDKKIRLPMSGDVRDFIARKGERFSCSRNLKPSQIAPLGTSSAALYWKLFPNCRLARNQLSSL